MSLDSRISANYDKWLEFQPMVKYLQKGLFLYCKIYFKPINGIQIWVEKGWKLFLVCGGGGFPIFYLCWGWSVYQLTYFTLWDQYYLSEFSKIWVLVLIYVISQLNIFVPAHFWHLICINFLHLAVYALFLLLFETNLY